VGGASIFRSDSYLRGRLRRTATGTNRLPYRPKYRRFDIRLYALLGRRGFHYRKKPFTLSAEDPFFEHDPCLPSNTAGLWGSVDPEHAFYGLETTTSLPSPLLRASV
jgi:hypothetical protein